MSCAINNFNDMQATYKNTSESGRICYVDRTNKPYTDSSCWLSVGFRNADNCDPKACPAGFESRQRQTCDICSSDDGCVSDRLSIISNEKICYCCLSNIEQVSNVNEIRNNCCLDILEDNKNYINGKVTDALRINGTRRLCKNSWCPTTTSSDCDQDFNIYCKGIDKTNDERCIKFCSTIPDGKSVMRYRDKDYSGCTEHIKNYCSVGDRIISDQLCVNSYSLDNINSTHPVWADELMTQYCKKYMANEIGKIDLTKYPPDDQVLILEMKKIFQTYQTINYSKGFLNERQLQLLETFNILPPEQCGCILSGMILPKCFDPACKNASYFPNELLKPGASNCAEGCTIIINSVETGKNVNITDNAFNQNCSVESGGKTIKEIKDSVIKDPSETPSEIPSETTTKPTTLLNNKYVLATVITIPSVIFLIILIIIVKKFLANRAR